MHGDNDEDQTVKQDDKREYPHRYDFRKKILFEGKEILIAHPETSGGINKKTISIRLSIFLIILAITTRLTWAIKNCEIRTRYAEHLAALK